MQKQGEAIFYVFSNIPLSYELKSSMLEEHCSVVQGLWARFAPDMLLH